MIPHSKPWLDASDTHAIHTVMTSGMIARGQHVAQFEQAIADYLSIPHAIAASSGTAALILALKALDIGPGREVILPTYVCHQVRDAVTHVGATAVLADVGASWCMTAAHAAPHITPNTAAIIAVHTFGQMANMTELLSLGVPIIEDACQAFGASHHGACAGTMGTMGIFSFHATKCLTTGEGGMVVCRDPQLATKLKALAVATPLSDIGAALGLSQLKRYAQFTERRTAIASRYHWELADLPITLPPYEPGAFYFRYPIRVTTDITQLIQQFAKHHIHVRRGVDALLHGDINGAFPGAEALYKTTLSIPLYPALTDPEQDAIIAACRTVFV